MLKDFSWIAKNSETILKIVAEIAAISTKKQKKPICWLKQYEAEIITKIRIWLEASNYLKKISENTKKPAANSSWFYYSLMLTMS